MPTFDGVRAGCTTRRGACPTPRTAAMVFLHGFGEHSGLYHRLREHPEPRGHRTLGLDEIGHGLTEGERAVIGSSTTWWRTAAG